MKKYDLESGLAVILMILNIIFLIVHITLFLLFDLLFFPSIPDFILVTLSLIYMIYNFIRN